MIKDLDKRKVDWRELINYLLNDSDLHVAVLLVGVKSRSIRLGRGLRFSGRKDRTLEVNKLFMI